MGCNSMALVANELTLNLFCSAGRLQAWRYCLRVGALHGGKLWAHYSQQMVLMNGLELLVF